MESQPATAQRGYTVPEKDTEIETARILLGHHKLSTTEVYAEIDMKKARRAARRLG